MRHPAKPPASRLLCVSLSVAACGIAFLAMLAFALATSGNGPDRYHYRNAMRDGAYCYALFGKLCPDQAQRNTYGMP